MTRGYRHLLATLERLRSTYWFVPAIMTVGAVALSLLLTTIDRSYPHATNGIGWAYGGGADGARALLSAVAGSMITVVSVTFSVMVVALTVSSQHFGPRLLRSFMRDQPAQLALGTFTGTFAYCLMTLRTVQSDGSDRFTFFVPHLAIAGAVVLALLAVGVLIYYVHHIAVALQLSEITNRIAHELEHTIDRLYPEPIGASAEPAAAPPSIPPAALPVRARHSGYVQEIDSEPLLALAARAQAIIWLTARPGDFVISGDAVASVWPPPADAEAVAAAVAKSYLVGADRTSQQDAAFGVQQLVEVALRALSPSTNEPFTAITSIDRLGQALTRLASRQIPSAIRSDNGGDVRVIAEPRTFVELAGEAFEPIALAAGDHLSVIVRLLETMDRLARVVRRPADREALARLVEITYAAARRNVDDERGRSVVDGLHDALRRATAPA